MTNEYVAAARQALQGNNLRITGANTVVAGSYRFLSQAPNTPAGVIVQTLASPADNSDWKAWNVIPVKCTTGADSSTWTIKADQEPPADRIILHDGRKVVITKMPSCSEQFELKQKNELAKREAAKAERRTNLLLSAPARGNPRDVEETSDPWAQALKQRSVNGTGSAPAPGSSTTVAGPSNADLTRVRQEVAVLASRIDMHEGRIDKLESTIESNHHDVMRALVSLGASTAPDPFKRASGVPTTPLKNEIGARMPKDNRGA